MSWGGDLFEDIQSTGKVQVAWRNLRAISMQGFTTVRREEAVGTVMSFGMLKGAYSKGHRLKPGPFRMDKTGKVNDNTPPSLRSETTPEKLQSDSSEEFVCGLLLEINSKKCNDDTRQIKYEFILTLSHLKPLKKSF